MSRFPLLPRRHPGHPAGKFVLNITVAINIMDGANVEMHQFRWDDNVSISSESSEQVIEHYASRLCLSELL